jgi:hypothetical protein
MNAPNPVLTRTKSALLEDLSMLVLQEDFGIIATFLELAKPRGNRDLR